VAPIVRPVDELRRFGAAWLLLGLALLGGSAALAESDGLSERDAFAALLFLGLSVSAVLGGLLLAKRTGPEQVYWRILTRAPSLPGRYVRVVDELKRPGVLGQALGVVAGLLFGALAGVAFTEVVLGEPRREFLDGLPAAIVGVAGGWTIVCGAAALRIAHYIHRWQKRYGGEAFCRHLNAGRMLHVYWVHRPPGFREPGGLED
jgi:hypothetical protein